MTNKIKPDSYQLRLMNDKEIKEKSETMFSQSYLISKNLNLDSNIFGVDGSGLPCNICNGTETCSLHSACIILPFPIVKVICLKDFKQIIQCICPICSSIPLTQTEKTNIMRLSRYDRLPYIKSELERITNKGIKDIQCPVCKNQTKLLRIAGSEPQLIVVVMKSNTAEFSELNPISVFTMLQRFKELDVAGFKIKYHPKDFMTIIIPIIPNMLRLKSFESSVSTISSYYKVIIEEIIPELDKIYKSLTPDDNISISRGDLLTRFKKYYDSLNAYYMLITDPTTEKVMDTCLSLINKRDRKHADKNASLIGLMRGKDKSYFTKGINEMRSDCSARTVLNGAPDSNIVNVNVPKHIASKLSIWYPVYEQNLKVMQQIVASMSNPSLYNSIENPRVLSIYNAYTKRTTKIEPKDAQTKASLIKPGDKIALSLIDGDFVLQSRFPSMREESWSSLQVKKDYNSVITLPLAICKMKTADFDGDEAQIYCSSNECYSIESLLLHSCYRQLISYKDGYQAILMSEADIPIGLRKIKQGSSCIIKNWEAIWPPLDIIKEVEAFLPKELNYSDKQLEIKNGKLLTEKTNFGSKEFYKYLTSLYGPYICCNIMDNLIQIAYDLNRDNGDTLGFNIRLFGKDTKTKIKEMKNKIYEKLKEGEQKNIPNKDIQQIIIYEKEQPEVKALLLESVKGTEMKEYATSRIDEYHDMVAELGQLLNQGNRIENILAEGSRVSCAFPRYSLDPCAYGFVNRSYSEDVGPIGNCYDSMVQRIQLFEKGQGTRKQGYMQKKLCTVYGTPFADFNGAVVDANTLISLQYGPCGADPRAFYKLPLLDFKLEDNVFNAKYPEIINIRVLIKEWRERFVDITDYIKISCITEEFPSMFNWEQYINQNLQKGKSDKKLVDELINDIRNIYRPEGFRTCNLTEDEVKQNNEHISVKRIENIGGGRKGRKIKGGKTKDEENTSEKVNIKTETMKNKYSIWMSEDMYINLYYHIYYFYVKFSEYKLTVDIKDDILTYFQNSLVNGGEPVGMKAAIAISEPLTQASLHSIHSHAGGLDEDVIERSTGITRFAEILDGITPKQTVITIGLYDDSEIATRLFAQKQETFYLSDIWIRCEIGISTKVNPLIKEQFSEIDFDELQLNPYFITMIWNISIISAYNIHVCDIIDKLIENFSSIMFIAGYVVNSSEFKVFIYFKPEIKLDQVNNLCEEFNQQKSTTVVHGRYLKNCYVSENKSRPGHYLLEANEINIDIHALENLIYNPLIDPSLCKTTNISTTYNLFGVCETNARTISDLCHCAIHLSETSGLLLCHYKTIADHMWSRGIYMPANRSSLQQSAGSKFDYLRTISFETAANFITDACRASSYISSKDSYVSGQFWGNIVNCGDGISDVILYEKDNNKQ